MHLLVIELSCSAEVIISIENFENPEGAFLPRMKVIYTYLRIGLYMLRYSSLLHVTCL